MNTLEKYKELCENVTKTYDEQVKFVDEYMREIDSLLKGTVNDSIRHNIAETITILIKTCPDISKDDIHEKVKMVFENNHKAFPSLKVE